MGRPKIYSEEEAKEREFSQKRRHQLQRYGVEEEQYQEMFVVQEGCCAICSSPDPGAGKTNFCVDHCHKTNRIRGLLCAKCNRGLGLAGDDPMVLTRAASYLMASKMSSRPSIRELKWMKLCLENSTRFSTCSKAQYFAVILDEAGKVLSQGYNGPPQGAIHCVDGGCQRPVDDSPSGSSYFNCTAAHAEAGAILRLDSFQRPEVIIINGTPCFDCARLIMHKAIPRVVCIRDDKYDFTQVRDMLAVAGTSVVEVSSEDLHEV